MESSNNYYLESEPLAYKQLADQFLMQRGWWPEWNRLHPATDVPGRVKLRCIPMDIGFPEAPFAESQGYADGILIDSKSPYEFFESVPGKLEAILCGG